MIVQCDQCNAKFRLDDSKVKDGGAKVRCSKCKHIFIVQREQSNDEADFESLLKGLVPPTPEALNEPLPSAAPEAEQPAAEAGESSGMGIRLNGEEAAGEVPTEQADFEFEEFSFDTGVAADSPAAASDRVEEKSGFDFGDLNLDAGDAAGEKVAAPEKEVASFEADEFSFAEEPPRSVPEKLTVDGSETPSFDYDTFSFADEAPPGEPENPVSGGIEAPSFDYDTFSFDDTPPPATVEEKPAAGSELPAVDFDAFSFSEGPPTLASDRQAADVSDKPSFDFDSFSFSEEQNQPVPDIETKTDSLAASQVSVDTAAAGTPFPPQQNDDSFAAPALDFYSEPGGGETIDAPFNPKTAKSIEPPPAFDFGEFKFEDVLPAEKSVVMEGGPAEQQGWSEELSSPVSQEHAGAFPLSELSADDDMPPAAISSRRRSSSFLPIAVTAISVLLVLVIAGGGFYFFKEGPAAFKKVGLGFAVKWFGLEAKEEGITVGNTAAAFLKNKEAGEIFAVNGEAINKFSKPRASIQVKVTVYGPKGEVLQQKTAYCGNALSREQLTTLPVAEIEKTMGNPFGDSLSNLSVQPGKGIPFVVVFTNVPKGAADFGIEVVGSTIAGK